MKHILPLVFCLLSTLAWGGQALVTGSVPTTRVDTTPLPLEEISEIRIYSGTDPDMIAATLSLSPVLTADFSHLFADLPPRTTYYFAATVVDTDGQESDMSDIVSKYIMPSRPNGPQIGVE